MKWFKYALDFIAVFGAVVGSTIIALNLGYNFVGYLAFLFSGFATIKLMKYSNVAKSIKFIAWFYVIINIIGLIRS